MTYRQFVPLGGVNVVMLDGSVRFVKDAVNQPTWWAVATYSGREVIQRAKLTTRADQKATGVALRMWIRRYSPGVMPVRFFDEALSDADRTPDIRQMLSSFRSVSTSICLIRSS